MSTIITDTAYNNVKKLAKNLKKTSNIKHSEALEIASRQAGFPTYHALNKTYRNQFQNNQSESIHEDELIRKTRNWLIKVINSDHGRKVIEKNKSIISRHHNNSEDIHPIVLAKLIEVYNHGVDDDGANINAGWSIVNWALDKEAIKELGHHYIKKDNTEDEITGSLLVALGHFFRSTADSYQSKRLVHPPFKVYLGDWLRSLRRGNTESNQILFKRYPENEHNGLAKGTTYWKTAE